MTWVFQLVLPEAWRWCHNVSFAPLAQKPTLSYIPCPRANHVVIPLNIEGLHLYFQAGVIVGCLGPQCRLPHCYCSTYFSASLAMPEISAVHVLTENDWTLKERVPSPRGDQYGAHICRNTQTEEHMDGCGLFYSRWVHRVYLCM